MDKINITAKNGRHIRIGKYVIAFGKIEHVHFNSCKYCDFSIDTIGENFDSPDEFFLMKTESGYKLCSDGRWGFRSTHISFCPKCGRELGGTP